MNYLETGNEDDLTIRYAEEQLRVLKNYLSQSATMVELLYLESHEIVIPTHEEYMRAFLKENG
jgi:hypothetical protein